MKKLAITAIILGSLAMGFNAQPAKADVSIRVRIGGFYDELAPYGRWVRCRYGRCWVPSRVSRRWRPYSVGRWVYTDYGWTWISRDPWGGSPYHYGSWVWLRGYGWAWVPGTVWAPAWVTWSYSDRYVGWAPLPPTYGFGASGYSGRAIVLSSTQYVFVPTNRFVDTDVTSVWVSPQQSATIFRQTRPVTQFAVSDGIIRNTGVPMATIQRATGGRIEARSISSANTTPQAMAAGGGGKGRRMAVVATAQDVNAAVAAPSAKAEKAEKVEKAPKEKARHESVSARPEPRPVSRQEPAAQRVEAKPERHEAKPPKAEHEAKPPKAEKAPKEREAPPPEVRQERAREQAPPPAAQAAPPKQEHEKPAKEPKEEKPPKEGKEKKEKH